jgi:GNAT superfamily N-acetyltransferase
MMRNPMTFTVRKAKVADLETLVSFAVSEADEAEGVRKSDELVRAGVKAGLEDNSVATYWVLEDENSIVVGNVSVVKEWSNWNAAYYWWIQSMYIRPEFRGMGLMRKLLSAVKDAARQEGALEIRLCVHKTNKRAIKAYRREGFSDSDYQIMTMRI